MNNNFHMREQSQNHSLQHHPQQHQQHQHHVPMNMHATPAGQSFKVGPPTPSQRAAVPDLRKLQQQQQQHQQQMLKFQQQPQHSNRHQPYQFDPTSTQPTFGINNHHPSTSSTMMNASGVNQHNTSLNSIVSTSNTCNMSNGNRYANMLNQQQLHQAAALSKFPSPSTFSSDPVGNWNAANANVSHSSSSSNSSIGGHTMANHNSLAQHGQHQPHHSQYHTQQSQLLLQQRQQAAALHPSVMSATSYGVGTVGDVNIDTTPNNNNGTTPSSNDLFVRSDSILDDDYVPFEVPTTSSKYGPISRQPMVSNNRHRTSNNESSSSSSLSSDPLSQWLANYNQHSLQQQRQEQQQQQHQQQQQLHTQQQQRMQPLQPLENRHVFADGCHQREATPTMLNSLNDSFDSMVPFDLFDSGASTLLALSGGMQTKVSSVPVYQNHLPIDRFDAFNGQLSRVSSPKYGGPDTSSAWNSSSLSSSSSTQLNTSNQSMDSGHNSVFGMVDTSGGSLAVAASANAVASSDHNNTTLSSLSSSSSTSSSLSSSSSSSASSASSAATAAAEVASLVAPSLSSTALMSSNATQTTTATMDSAFNVSHRDLYEFGIDSGMRELELRLKSELEEHEKMWDATPAVASHASTSAVHH